MSGRGEAVAVALQVEFGIHEILAVAEGIAEAASKRGEGSERERRERPRDGERERR